MCYVSVATVFGFGLTVQMCLCFVFYCLSGLGWMLCFVVARLRLRYKFMLLGFAACCACFVMGFDIGMFCVIVCIAFGV